MLDKVEGVREAGSCHYTSLRLLPPSTCVTRSPSPTTPPTCPEDTYFSTSWIYIAGAVQSSLTPEVQGRARSSRKSRVCHGQGHICAGPPRVQRWNSKEPRQSGDRRCCHCRGVQETPCSPAPRSAMILSSPEAAILPALEPPLSQLASSWLQLRHPLGVPTPHQRAPV